MNLRMQSLREVESELQRVPDWAGHMTCRDAIISTYSYGLMLIGDICFEADEHLIFLMFLSVNWTALFHAGIKSKCASGYTKRGSGCT